MNQGVTRQMQAYPNQLGCPARVSAASSSLLILSQGHMHSVAQPRQHHQRAEDVCQQNDSTALALLTLQGASSAILFAVSLDAQGADGAVITVTAQLAQV